MVIVFVIDMFDIKKNGTTMTAQRFTKYLRQNGHEVRVVSTGEEEPGKYVVPERHIPVVDYFSKKQSFIFAKPDENVLRNALQGADVAHLFLPMALEKKALKIANEMGVPCSGAFHLQPENITYNINMGNCKWLSDCIYKYMLKSFYSNFSHIHCPSHFIAEQLVIHDYKAKLHVISNGITSEFHPVKKLENKDGLFHVLMIGRLSPEKRQDLLIDAVAKSKYSEKIQLHFAGTGPEEHALRHRARHNGLKNFPTFGFYPKEELLNLIYKSDLYVHTSDAEIEAIACLEAIACGKVPVISDSKKSATSQFALTEKSLFQAGNSSSLSKKIDYWIENPEEKQEMEMQYASFSQKYSIEYCVHQIEEMFEETIRDAKKKK